MANKVSNNAYGYLAAAMTATSTTVTLQTGQGTRFPVLSAGADQMWCTLVNASNAVEIVLVTGHTSGTDVFTVTRGQDGTTALTWNVNDRFELRPVAALMNAKADLNAANTWTSLQSYNNGITIVSGGMTVDAGGITVDAGGITVLAGGANITGAVVISGPTTYTSNVSITAGGLAVSAGGVVVNAGGLAVNAGGATFTGPSTGALTLGTSTAASIWQDSGSTLTCQAGSGGVRWVNNTNTTQIASLTNAGLFSVPALSVSGATNFAGGVSGTTGNFSGAVTGSAGAAFAGLVTTPAASIGDSSTNLATTSFVQNTSFGYYAGYHNRSSPALGTPYTPSNTKPAFVSITLTLTTAGQYIIVTLSGATIFSHQVTVSGNQPMTVSFMVQANTSYTVTLNAGSASAINSWAEFY